MYVCIYVCRYVLGRKVRSYVPADLCTEHNSVEEISLEICIFFHLLSHIVHPAPGFVFRCCMYSSKIEIRGNVYFEMLEIKVKAVKRKHWRLSNCNAPKMTLSNPRSLIIPFAKTRYHQKDKISSITCYFRKTRCSQHEMKTSSRLWAIWTQMLNRSSIYKINKLHEN